MEIGTKTFKILNMNLDQSIREMEGKISLLDNKKFIYFAGILGVYYAAYLGFLTYIIIGGH